MKPSNQPMCNQSSTSDKLRTRLIQGGAGNFVMQIGFAGLSFLNAMFLARVLAPANYGAYANAMSWVNLLVIPSSFGFGAVLVRDMAIYRSNREWSILKGVLCFSNGFVLILSILFALALAVIAMLIFQGEEVMRYSLWVAAPLVPLIAISGLCESAMWGLEHLIFGRFPGMVLRPILMLAGFLLIYIYCMECFSAPVAMMVHVGAGMVSLVTGLFFLRRLLPPEVNTAKRVYKPQLWLSVAFPLMIHGSMQIILGQTDIVMLGVMRNAEEVGLYAVSTRLAYLMTYVTYASESVLAPIMARMNNAREKEQLHRIIVQSARICFFLVLPFGLILILKGNWVLGIFGDDYSVADPILSILTLGRLVDVFLGSSALLLAMTGHERFTAIVFVGAGVGNVVLNVLLIPIYGGQGAAIASVTSLILVKVIFLVYVMKKVGLNASVFGDKWHYVPNIKKTTG